MSASSVPARRPLSQALTKALIMLVPGHGVLRVREVRAEVDAIEEQLRRLHTFGGCCPCSRASSHVREGSRVSRKTALRVKQMRD